MERLVLLNVLSVHLTCTVLKVLIDLNFVKMMSLIAWLAFHKQLPKDRQRETQLYVVQVPTTTENLLVLLDLRDTIVPEEQTQEPHTLLVDPTNIHPQVRQVLLDVQHVQVAKFVQQNELQMLTIVQQVL